MTDTKLGGLLARTMLAGVLIAALVMAAGLVWYLSAHPGQQAGDHLFSGEPIYLRNAADMLRMTLDFQATGHRKSLIQLGVLLLLFNPLLRVALAAMGYFGHRDWLYACSSLAVLTILLLSFFL